MPRFLISTMAAAGHVTPAIAVAAELVSRGHDVIWHTGPEWEPVVTATGARFSAAVHAPSLTELSADPDPGTTGAAQAVSALRHLLVDRMAGQLADYEAILDAQPVDAVVVDLCALGGRALHDKRGIPWATLGISPLAIPAGDIPPFGSGRLPPRNRWGRWGNAAYWRLGRVLMRGLDEAYSAQREALGLPALSPGESTFDHMTSGQLHLQASTPAIEFPRRPWPEAVHLVGPLIPPAGQGLGGGGGFRLPAWWGELDEVPTVVHVTQGSVATDPQTLTLPALEALDGLDVLVIVTSPEPSELGSVPSNTRVSSFIPHGLLLPRVDVMVTNAGFNGVKAALAHGVPMVLAPWGNDQPDVAARVRWAGAGIDLRTRTPEPAAVRVAVQTVLADPHYREAARRVEAEFALYPGGQRAADCLESLVGVTGPGSGRRPQGLRGCPRTGTTW